MTSEPLIDISYESETIQVQTGVISAGGTQNGIDYGVEYEFLYDPTLLDYAIDQDNELLSLFMLDTITPLEILNASGDEVTGWTQPYSGSELLINQSLIRFGSGPNIENFSTFTVKYKFDFDFGSNNYISVTLGPSLDNDLNMSWIALDLLEGFIPDNSNSHSDMFVRYNKTIIGSDSVGPYSLDYGINGVTQYEEKYFRIYNSSRPISSQGVTNGIPEITFSQTIPSGEKVYIIYGVRSQFSI
jgi:hypothetical protein